MMRERKNLIVGQSGGPTAVINASLYGVVTEALRLGEVFGQVYGMINGIEGVLSENLMDMRVLDEHEMSILKYTPGAYLGSCRYKLPEDLSDPIYESIFKIFEKYEIGYFFYIGGNDSMDTVSKLSRCAAHFGADICFVGIPKTVDNDLVLTDHTPGFGSAAKYVATTVAEIAVDASVYDHRQSVTIVEIMGRHAGWLTGASALAREISGDAPDLIYMPETTFSIDKFVDDIRRKLEQKNNLIVCVSEGIHTDDGTFICELDSHVGEDTFGHKMLAGAAKYLEEIVREKIGVKVRSVELNVSQRCSSMMLSRTDQKEASGAGAFGVMQAALRGREEATGNMVAFVRASSDTYKIDYCLRDVNRICNREKTIPEEWVTKDGTDVTEDFIHYVRPLIEGEVKIERKNGVPVFARRSVINRGRRMI